jgi:hypothetical protein
MLFIRSLCQEVFKEHIHDLRGNGINPLVRHLKHRY